MGTRQLSWELGARMDQLRMLPEVMAGLTVASSSAVALFVTEYMAETQAERDFTIGMVIDAYKEAFKTFGITVQLEDD